MWAQVADSRCAKACSGEAAFRYALSMPVATVVAGINSDAMLKTDLEMVSRFTPMSDAEKEEVYTGGA